MTKGSDLLVRALENEGVDRIFGVPGEENLDVVAESMALVRSATKSGVLMRWDYNCEDPHADMRGFLGKAIPGMTAGAGPQLLVLAGAVIASSSPAAVSWLYFANRLIELPLGIVGVAMGSVLVPELTRAVRGGDQGPSRAEVHC